MSNDAATPSRFASLFRQVGPALILATVVIGPGSLTLHTIAGAKFGYRMLWVPVVGTLLMLAYTHTAARISLVTRRTLFDLTRHQYGKTVARVAGVLAFLAVLAFQSGNTAAVGFASEAFLGGDVRWWSTWWTLVAVGLMLLPKLYAGIETIVKIIVGVMLATFVGTLCFVGVDVPSAAMGLVPSRLDSEAAFLALGMAGTTFSIVAAVYQGYLIKEKGWTMDRSRSQTIDSVIGIAILGTISCIILMTSAKVLHGRDAGGISVQIMAAQLEPLVGSSAFYLFTIGFFFASFSSLVVNPLIGATLLADGLGQPSAMDGRTVRSMSVAGLLAGLAVVWIFDGSPTELIRFAQGIAVIAFPLLGFLIIALSRREDLMGQWRTPAWLQVVLILGFGVLVAIVANYIKTIAGI